MSTSPPKAAASPEEELAALFQQALTLHQQGQLNQAKTIFEQVLAKQPKHFGALHLLGIIAAQSNNPALAVQLLDQAIEIDPSNAATHSNRGNVLQELKRFEEAVASYARAIEIQTNHIEAYCNRGVALTELKRQEEALVSYERAIEIKPDHLPAHYNRGITLRELNRLEEAVASYERAIEIKPDYPEAHLNRGFALQALEQLEAAIACYEQAIKLKPDYLQAYINRGFALQEMQRLEEAVANYEQVFKINPGNARAHFDKSFCLLLTGQLREGWKLYEWRWRDESKGLKARLFQQPLWLGLEDITNKTLLLHAEQGLGDTIQFCRYAKLVKQAGAKVLLEVPQAMMDLLKRLEGVDQLIAQGTPLPAFDYHCPLLSLPLALGTELHTIPQPAPYLSADPDQRSQWMSKLGDKTKTRVGLVWSGSTGHYKDRSRSLQLKELLPHLPANCEYVSLQKEVRELDQNALMGSNIKHYGEQLKDFSDTAALCDLMDIVISVDTSVAHLAGAIGKTTWVLLPYTPDWRWLLNRADSPWYASVKLFRQDHQRKWQPVLERVAKDLLEISR